MLAFIYLTGCQSGGYGSRNDIQHSYTTSTQRGGHQLYGVEVTARPAIPVFALGQALFLTKLNVTFYLNREKIDSFNVSRKYNTFIKLPPGEHEFAYRMVQQGVMSLGIKVTESFVVYKFVVPEEGIAKIVVDSSVIDADTREADAYFENTPFSEFLGRCKSLFGNCKPI